ncbi:MAG TPA: hypothetical protein ENG91_07315 [Desulfobacteraceae bacterium]|nr:tyrosine-protein phosphatase YwqE [bacterium BMS3Abin13]HDK44342.1 hypothetical protein [Desulfobacteraceae bacterium]
MNGLIDIHSHILPGFDDGPENIEQSIEAARRYKDIGVNCVVATPHRVGGTRWSPYPAAIIAAAEKTEAALNDAGVSLQILPGMEIACPENIDADFLSAQFLSLGHSGYFLIEFPFTSAITDTIRNVTGRAPGRKQPGIIVAHPERCTLFQDNGATLRQAVAGGMLAQVNIASLFGEFGAKAAATAFDFLRLGLVHFLATDSHARGNRMPPDPRQWERLVELLGQDVVETACMVNPGRMLRGEKVPPITLPDETRRNTQPPGHNRNIVERLINIFNK